MAIINGEEVDLLSPSLSEVGCLLVAASPKGDGKAIDAELTVDEASRFEAGLLPGNNQVGQILIFLITDTFRWKNWGRPKPVFSFEYDQVIRTFTTF